MIQADAYNFKYIPNNYLEPKEVTPKAQIKVFRHDSSNGDYFRDLDAALNWNFELPDATLFSILDQLENFRRPDGKFRFKLCYPERWGWAGGRCNEWLQTSNPVTDTEITGFERISNNLIAFRSRLVNGATVAWEGIGRSNDSSSGSLIDDDPTGSNWFTAIGAYRTGKETLPNTIPGPYQDPYADSFSMVHVVELYVLT